MSKQLDPLGKTAPELHLGRGKIIIIGDSWACGEWLDGQNTHRGLEAFLVDHGYYVINLGEPAGSNSGAISSLKNHLFEKGRNNVVGIFHFWTEWHRDFYLKPPAVWDMIDFGHQPSFYPLKNYDENLVHRLTHRRLTELGQCAEVIQIPIGLIGGCSDVVDVGDCYPGLYTICQSMTNLCLNDDHTVSDPVFSTFNDISFIDLQKKHLSTADMNIFLQDVDKGIQRHSTWKSNQHYFSDGRHGNRIAHKKLFELMLSNGSI